mgnify:CR=1 FL=1
MRFREELLARWPDIEDVLEPSEFDLEDSPDGKHSGGARRVTVSAG